MCGRCSTKKQNYICIDTIEIDIDSLFSIEHACIPGKCHREQCCCSKYEIVVDRDEEERVIGYMAAAARYASHLGNEASLENIFEEDEEGSLVLDTDEDGLCLFAYRDRRRNVLCSLHSVALDLKIPYCRTKPKSCVLWPLAVSEDLPLQLSLAEDAFDFPCNARRKNPGNALDPNIAQIIQDVFGIQLLTAVDKASQ